MLGQPEPQNNQYEFSAPPRTMGSAFQKYRETMNSTGYQFGNPMYDPRIVRGNTYAAIVTSQEQTDQQKKQKRQVPVKKVKVMKPRQVSQFGQRTDTPPPLMGRNHVPIQTEEYQELLTDKPPEHEEESQTNFYIDRPLPRLFNPKKTGIDKDTQIWEGEIFDFDEEVDPILEVLITKTLEQGRMEVIEEQELRRIKYEHSVYEQKRFNELAEVQRLEEKENRYLQEQHRRERQYSVFINQEEHGHKKIISRLMAKKFLRKLKPTSFQILHDQGFFKQPLKVDIHYDFAPWLMNRISQKVRTYSQSRTIGKDFAQNLKQKTIQRHFQSLQAEKKRKQDIIDAEEQQRLEYKQGKLERAAQRRKDQTAKKIADFKKELIDDFFKSNKDESDVFSHFFTDINANYKRRQSVCVLGGFIGEFIITFSTVMEFVALEDNKENLGIILDWKHRDFQALFDWMFKNFLSGGIDVPIKGTITDKLNEIQEGMKVHHVHKLLGATKKKAARQLLIDNVGGVLLDKIFENHSKLGFTKKLIESVTKAFSTMAIKGLAQKLLNFVLLEEPDVDLKAYLKATAPVPVDEATPPSRDSTSKGRSGTKNSQSKSMSRRRNIVIINKLKLAKQKQLDAQKIMEDNQEEIKEPVEPEKATIAEYELADFVRPTNPNLETKRVLFYHEAAAIQLRREIIYSIAEQFEDKNFAQQLADLEIEIMNKINTKAQIIEQNYIKGDLAKGLQHYEREQY